MKNRVFHSLRGRYLAGTILLGLFVLISAIIAYNYVTDTREQSIDNLDIRNKLLKHSRLARDAVWKSRESIEAFLLDPDNKLHKNDVFASLREAVSHTDILARQPWIFTIENKQTIDQLSSSLNELETHADELIHTRIDSTKQYPALAAARTYMLPNHRAFYTAISLALDEITSEDDSNQIKNTAFNLFIQSRHIWTQMISNFRMYLANRMGSFSPEILLQQELDTLTLYKELNLLLKQLSAIEQRGKLGFQGSVSLEELISAKDDWHKGLVEIMRIHSTDEWRADSQILKNQVHPLMQKSWELLQIIDVAIETSANNDVTKLSSVSKGQSQIIWIITFLVLVVTAFGFVFMERLILRPLALVTQALKAKAIGVEGTHIPPSTLHETSDLIDAFSEMNKQVNARQVDLEYQALHDGLTGLPNRTLLLDRLQQAIFTARREHSHLTLLIMDLDGFKEVNDTVGHQVGDSLLKEVGVRLLITIREMDTVARLGGDEFAILLPDLSDHQATNVAAKIRHTLEEVFVVDDLRLYISASIGIAAYPEHGARAQTLIQRADVAMYVAKRNKSGHAIYNPKEDQHSVGRLALMSDLRHALDIQSLHLHYQPKVNIADNSVIGVEALLRWNHPKFGMIPPDEIIPLSEQTGLIKPLTLWVLDESAKQSKEWLSNDIKLCVAVNLSVYNLQDLDFIDEVKKTLEKYDLKPEYIRMEVTESTMMANPQNAVQVLTQLDEMGVKIAIDDFGTGFSSLAYLKQLPVDELKIDKSFVIDMTESEDDAVIVRSTIDLAHNLGLKVVAEGVESREAWNILEILGCDLAQGIYMGSPMTTSDLEIWLEDRTSQDKSSNVIKFVK